MSIRKRFLIFTVLLMGSGCISVKHYADPALRSETTPTFVQTGPPRLVTIDFEYQEFPLTYTFGDRNLREEIVRILTESNAFVEADSSNNAKAGNLRIVLHRRVRSGDYLPDWKVMAPAFTMGLMGTTSAQPYEMTIVYTPPGGTVTTWEYNHTVHAACGRTPIPQNAQTASLRDVKNQMLADMLNKFIHDVQAVPVGHQIASSADSLDPIGQPIAKHR